MPWVVTEFQELAFTFGTLIASLGILVLLGKWWAQ